MNQNLSDKIPRKKDSKFVKKVKQNMYKWHRTLGIITIIPVILWTLSGLMHPFMAHFFKPQIANEKIETKAINLAQVHFSIQEVLKENKIEELKNFRIISFENETYYQVKTSTDELLYFNTFDGRKLENGDQKYANWLARYFLDDSKSEIKNTEILTEFDNQYKYVNRYLPVYKLSFDRPDGMQIYVETVSSKLATYNPKSRQLFIWFFDNFHNWSFIDSISNANIRIFIMILFLSIICFSAFSGILIYGFLWKKFRKLKNDENNTGLRKYHRQIGIWVSIFTLTFALSGAFHSTTKWETYTLDKKIYETIIKTKDISISSKDIALDTRKIENLSMVAFNDSIYYRCQLALAKKENTAIQPTISKSKWGKKEDPKSEIVYINATSNKKNATLDFEYAAFLANYFNSNTSKTSCCEMDESTENSTSSIENVPIKKTEILYEFESREYGFVNKRLPVVKLAYETPDNKTYFIETATGRLAASITNSDRVEGYSFAIFHKFLFMDWAGKNIRDLATVLAALTILLVSILGLVLFIRK